MVYRTTALAVVLSVLLLTVGATTAAADHQERFGGNDTFTLEIGHIGGEGETCLYDEGDHVNRVEVSNSLFLNTSIYHTGDSPMQINIPSNWIEVVLWSNGSNDEVDDLATPAGTCVPNDIDQVVLKVYLLHANLENAEDVEVLTGADVGDPPPAGTGAVAGIETQSDAESSTATPPDPVGGIPGLPDDEDQLDPVTDPIEDATDDVADREETAATDSVTDAVDDPVVGGILERTFGTVDDADPADDMSGDVVEDDDSTDADDAEDTDDSLAGFLLPFPLPFT